MTMVRARQLVVVTALTVLVPLAALMPVAVVVIGGVVVTLRAGRWFATALREAEDAHNGLIPVYVSRRRSVS